MEGDSQPCLHDTGIKPGDTCAAAGFNLFFQQFLKQADLVTEIPLGHVENFLSSPVSTTMAQDGPTFVDDDAVLLCGDSPSQFIDKIQEATRIYVDTARNFGLTLNFNQDSGRSGCSLAQDPRPGAAPCLGVQTCGSQMLPHPDVTLLTKSRQPPRDIYRR